MIISKGHPEKISNKRESHNVAGSYSRHTKNQNQEILESLPNEKQLVAVIRKYSMLLQ